MFMPDIFKDNFIDNFFDDDIRFPFQLPAKKEIMKTDIKDAGDHFELSIELPGYSKDEIKVELNDNALIVSAEKETNKDDKDDKGNYIRRERHFGSCRRTFNLNDNVTEEDIGARFENGILFVDINKKEEIPEKEEKRLIEIS